MTYKGYVRNGVVVLPGHARIEDGTEVDVTVRPRGTRLADLLKHAGMWHGEDADEIVETIYRLRSSRQAPLFDHCACFPSGPLPSG